MSTDNVFAWSATPGSNLDVAGNGIQGSSNLSLGNDVFQNVMAQIASGTILRGTDIATSATLDFTAVGVTTKSLIHDLTGTVTVTAVTLTASQWRLCRAQGVFQITASATLIVNGSTSVNYTTTAGDLIVIFGYGSSTVRLWAFTGGAVTAATTSASGIVELATVAEALTGTDAVRAVTPAGLYYPTGHLYGLTLSTNASDATNDIDIAAGDARDASDSFNYVVSSAIGKQLDVAWALGGTPGTTTGGLDTGAVGNNRYAIWGIGRSDTQVRNVLFSLSFTAPTMPTNYDYKVLLGEVTRAGGVNGTPIWYGRLDLHLLHVREEEASGTDGGTFTSGAWRTRVLNTVKVNAIVGASLSSNQVILPAGTYEVIARAPASAASFHKLKLANITDTTDTLIGGSAEADSATTSVSESVVLGRFTIASQKTFELQHRCNSTRATSGLGRANSLSVVEVYAEAIFRKVG